MKMAIVSIHDTTEIKKYLKKHGFVPESKNPDIVIAYGGDGTLLHSERKYPGIPKLVVKTSRICRKCDYTKNQLDAIFEKISKNGFRIKKEMKLTACYKNREYHALNEISIRNSFPAKALRFYVSVNKKMLGEFIGDGVVIATPFGSSAYFRSAGGKEFKKGIGICLNNPFTNIRKKYKIYPENTVIEVKIMREKADLCNDNNKITVLNRGDEIIVKKSKEYAKIIVIN